MSQIGLSRESNRKPALSVITGEGLQDFRARIHERIAQCAYRLYEAGGRKDGRDAEDWFTAEARFLRPPTIPPVEFSREVKVQTELGRDIPQEILVGIEPERVIVWAKAESGTCFPPQPVNSPSPELMQVFDLPKEIDPAQAAVSFKEGTLEIDLPKHLDSAHGATGSGRRTIRLQRTVEGLPEYYYCTACGWVHTQAEFLSKNEPTVSYHHEVAELAFKNHDCKDHPRVLEAGTPLG